MNLFSKIVYSGRTKCVFPHSDTISRLPKTNDKLIKISETYLVWPSVPMKINILINQSWLNHAFLTFADISSTQCHGTLFLYAMYF